MNNQVLFGIGGIVVGAVLVGAFSSGMSRNNMMSGVNRENTDNRMGMKNQMMGNIDKHFIEQMIPHHEDAVLMSKMALEKAEHPEIKILAQAIIDGQTKEINDMRGWYKDWFRTEVPDGGMGMMMSHGGMGMNSEDDMKMLEDAKDFDKVFIEQMVPHHQMALMMVRMLTAGTNRPEMSTLAKNITDSQSKEIQDMQTWYKDWYQ